MPSMKKARRADVRALKKKSEGRGTSRALSSLLAGKWWEVPPEVATELQRELRQYLDLETPLPKDPDLIAAFIAGVRNVE